MPHLLRDTTEYLRSCRLKRGFFNVLVMTAMVACQPVEQVLEPEPTMPDNQTKADTSRQDSMLAIEGQVAYRARIALRPDAQLRVQLLDVSRQDASAQVISEVYWPTNGRQVPIPFSLNYEGEQVVRGHRYALRAALIAEDVVLFHTADSVPVISNGITRDIQIQLVAATEAEPTASLNGTRWSLVSFEAADAPEVPKNDTASPHVTFDDQGRLSGASGVNRFSGAYESDDSGKLRLTGPVAVTRMAGPADRMLLEQTFIAALTGVDRFAIEGKTLRLYEGGAEVMRFTALDPEP